MRPHMATMSEADFRELRLATVFLDGRLKEQATVEWALHLKPSDRAKRFAVSTVLDTAAGRKLTEPWRSAWRLIEESWACELDTSTASHLRFEAASRIKSGERSGALILQITNLVRPAVQVKAFSQSDFSLRKPRKTPRHAKDILHASLTSGEVFDPRELGLSSIEDAQFLEELAHDLYAVVTKGLDIGRRLGWRYDAPLWLLGELNRVYFVPENLRGEDQHEPDEFHTGIAPSVKLFYAVLMQLRSVSVDAAHRLTRQLREAGTPVHTRVWAAMARHHDVASSGDMGEFLTRIGDRYFWNVHSYPEIAELRSVRFGSLTPADQASILERVRNGPPASLWRGIDRDRVAKAQQFWLLRELRRIEIAGATLPIEYQTLLRNARDDNDLRQVARLDDGFPGISKAQAVPPNPDDRYELLSGEGRLRALEDALAAPRRSWDDDPASRASDWIRKPQSAPKLIQDLEHSPQSGGSYARVWEALGWAHSSLVERQSSKRDDDRRQSDEAERVLRLLTALPTETICQAIDGIAHWLDSWSRLISGDKAFSAVWLRIWPLAVKATNQEFENEAKKPARELRQEQETDILNSPVGKLISAFLAACPKIRKDVRPFEDHRLRAMRDAISQANGRSAVIGRHRLLESLVWFMRADRKWTYEHLIQPLLTQSPDTPALWRAVARAAHYRDTVSVLGSAMIHRASDPSLSRDTRKALVFGVVVETLHALFEKRKPEVDVEGMQQMLRSLEDEVRAFAADIVPRFVRDMSTTKDEQRSTGRTRDELFRKAAKEFLASVWPQERSLTTPGIARALSDLPAESGDAFADAVASIERFLVPFDSWSLLDYGLWGDEDGVPKLHRINNKKKAEALLRLLDLTIGTSESARVPGDLASALDQIAKITPRLRDDQAFRRLSTLTR